MRRQAPPADRLPTLTEVVELGQETRPAVPFGEEPFEDAETAGGSGLVGAAQDRADDEADYRTAVGDQQLVPPPGLQELSASVMAELQPRIEALLEARLREALAPALARAADGLIRDSRIQLTEALQSLVQEAVVKVLDRGESR